MRYLKGRCLSLQNGRDFITSFSNRVLGVFCGVSPTFTHRHQMSQHYRFSSGAGGPCNTSLRGRRTSRSHCSAQRHGPLLPPGLTQHKLGCGGPLCGDARPAPGGRRTATLRAPARAACGTACSAATHSETPLCARHAGPSPGGGQRPFPRVSRRDSPAQGPYAPQRALSPARSRRCSPAHLNPPRRRADLERCFRICFLMIPAMAPAGTHRSPRPARSGNAPHPSASPSPSGGDRGERRSRCQHSR